MTNAFWDDLNSDMQGNPARVQRLKLEVARIEAIDRTLNTLNEARDAQEISKAELAKKMGLNAAVVRRLFTKRGQNPQFGTVATMAAALGYRLEAVPISGETTDLDSREAFSMPVSGETPRVA